jgi:predicted dienelactone hydrolase
MNFPFGTRRQASFIRGLLCGLTIAGSWLSFTSASEAAQRVTLRFGPFEQSVSISDLEQFAKTGRLSSSLQLYSPVFTPQVRELLLRHLQLDPAVGNQLIGELVRSPSGKGIVESLGTAIPGSTVQSLQSAIALATRQANGLSVLGFLRSYPQENLTVDATRAIALAVQVNPTYWQSQALGSLLQRELAVSSPTPFRATFDPAALGKETVQLQTIVLRDRQRQRNISVDLYTSQKQDPQQPLVVMSHGFGANRKFLGYLARHLASHGLTVAAIEHPGSDVKAVTAAVNQGNIANLMPASEYVELPRDVSFVLDQLAKLNTQPGTQGKFNTENVTTIGHSLGAYTALALVGGEVNIGELRKYCQESVGVGQAPGDWLQCAAAKLPDQKFNLADQRVKSAIALNPLIGSLFGKSGLNQVTKPVLILTGTDDSLTPSLTHQLRPFTQLHSTKYLLTAIGGTHLSIGDPANLANTAATTTIVKERLGGDTQPLRQLLQGVSLAFIKQQTNEAKIYQPFLTPAYAQSLSTSALPLRLNSELPGSIKPWLEFVMTY